MTPQEPQDKLLSVLGIVHKALEVAGHDHQTHRAHCGIGRKGSRFYGLYVDER